LSLSLWSATCGYASSTTVAPLVDIVQERAARSTTAFVNPVICREFERKNVLAFALLYAIPSA
jgi:hypothetical protein